MINYNHDKLDLTFVRIAQRKNQLAERNAKAKAYSESCADRITTREIVLSFLGTIGVFSSIIGVYFLGCCFM